MPAKKQLGKILAELHQERVPVDLRSLGGPRRRVLQCHHRPARRYPVAEIWGHHLVGTKPPWNRHAHDICDAAGEVWIGCTRCGKIRRVDFELLSGAMRTGPKKSNMDQIATATVLSVARRPAADLV